MKKIKVVGLLVLSILFVSETLYAIDFSSHGYYRSRIVVTEDLDTQKPGGTTTYNNNRFGMIAFNQMRLRLDPVLKVNDFISVHTQFDFLDNLMYGTNDTQQLNLLSPVVGTVNLPAGAGSISMVGGAAGNNGSLNVRRAWMEVMTPVGKLRVGRQPSHWGLGIFQNDGNQLYDDFGDSADRIMFITQKQFDDGGALSVGALWDIAFEAQPDPRIQGLGGVVRDNGQDTNQWAGIIYYERPDLSVGVFGGIRKRDGGSGTTTTAMAFDRDTVGALTSTAAGIDGDTMVYFIDAYGKYEYLDYTLALEVVYLGGEMSTGVAIDAIPLGNAMQNLPAPRGVIQLPAKQSIQVLMAAFEAGARYKWGGEWKLKAGYAQGDGSPLSNKITTYGFRPDYQVAFLMFDYPLGTSPAVRNSTAITNTAGTATTLAAGSKAAGGLPITGNFINNAIYVGAEYKHHFDFTASCKNCNEFSAGLRVVTAWADKNPVDLDLASVLPASVTTSTLPMIQSQGKWYGLEVDVIVEALFYDFLHARFEGGVLIPGAAYDINPVLIDPNSYVTPIDPDKASMAYGGRLTLAVEF